jgi:hypothetical protein
MVVKFVLPHAPVPLTSLDKLPHLIDFHSICSRDSDVQKGVLFQPLTPEQAKSLTPPADGPSAAEHLPAQLRPPHSYQGTPSKPLPAP